MKTSFLAKYVILLLFVPDYEFLESNTFRGLVTPKQIFQLMVLSNLIKTNLVERERDVGKNTCFCLLNDVKSVSMYYYAEHNGLNFPISYSMQEANVQ